MKEKIFAILKIILSIPKIIYFNFKVFNFRTAIKLPILITNNVRIKKIYKGCIFINSNNIKPFMIKIGILGSSAINSQKGMIYINPKQSGKIIFKGESKFCEGIVLYNNGGILEFGNNFIANKNCFISCDMKINFGNNVLLGWNINIRDSDGHTIIYDNEEKKGMGTILVGNHVWICSCVDILKNNYIGDNCIVAYRSCLTGMESKQNQLIGGYPAKILKENISWKK